MKTEFLSNPKHDLGRVINGLHVKLYQVLEHNTIPKSSSEVVYNQLTELEQVGYRINDDFDLIKYARSLNMNGADISSNTPNGSTGASQSQTVNVI